MKLGLILPTRHRAEHAISAIQSILAQRGCELALIVSDNSSSEDDVRRLAEFCRATGDPRLTYLRPTEALPMPTHWDWAIGQALARTDATHYGIQYDRKVWKPDHLRLLADACARETELLVTYACDFTYPAARGRFGAWQMPASGKLYEIATQRVIDNVAHGRVQEMGHAWPVLSNCMLPRAVLERVHARFGNYCDSSTPDTAFAFRFCATHDGYRHLDRGVVVVFAFDRSNALSLFRGEAGGTWGDFAQLWGDRPWAPAAPIPDLRLGQNVTFHEYNLVRHEAGDRLPPIEMPGYLRELAHALPSYRDAELQAKMREALERHGWRADPPRPAPSRTRVLLSRLAHAFRSRERTFATDHEAVDYLIRHPRPLAPHNELLAPMDAVEVTR